MNGTSQNVSLSWPYYFTKNKPSFSWIKLIFVYCLLFLFLIYPSLACEVQTEWNTIIQTVLALTSSYAVSCIFFYINIYNEDKKTEIECIDCIAKILFQLKIARKKIDIADGEKMKAFAIFFDDESMILFNRYVELLIAKFKMDASKLSSNIYIIAVQLDLAIGRLKYSARHINEKYNNYEDKFYKLHELYGTTLYELEEIISRIANLYADGDDVIKKINQKVFWLSQLELRLSG